MCYSKTCAGSVMMLNFDTYSFDVDGFESKLQVQLLLYLRKSAPTEMWSKVSVKTT